MATVTSSIPSSLVEWQRRVRHPLERARGTIRLYVGLEAASLLLTILALWFWIGLAFDYGMFRGFGFDWVQEIPRPARAFGLGALFLLVVFALRMDRVVSQAGEEIRAILRTAFAVTTGRQRPTMAVWLRLPLVGMTVGLLALGGWAVSVWLENPGIALLGVLAAAGAGALVTVLHEAIGIRGWSSIHSALRATVAGLFCFAGGYYGYALGFRLAGVTGAIVGAGVLAALADAVGLIVLSTTVLLARGRCYVLALSLPLIAAYLAAWVGSGWLADFLGAAGSGVLVALLLAGPVLIVAAIRLFHDFRDDAIALVLERRFPQQLGDRLITAVELADPRKAAKYGYSQAMIEQTIHEAAERVGQVPVHEIFAWRRLLRYFVAVVGCTIGLYLVSAANGMMLSLAEAQSASPPAVFGVLALDVYALAAAVYLLIRHGKRPGIVAAGLLGVVVVGFALYGVAHVYLTVGLFAALMALAMLVVAGGAVGLYFLLKKRVWSGIDIPLLATFAAAGVLFAASNSGRAADFAEAFNDVSGLWLERNVLLQNAIWPRQAHLEVLDWNLETGEQRVGRDGSQPLRLRAIKWVVADPAAREGWRALTWADLEKRRDILPEPPSADLARDRWEGVKNWGRPRDADWTLDEIDLRLEKNELRTELPAETRLAFEGLFEKLRERAADPAMRRTMRMLKVPASVTVYYRNSSGNGEKSLSKQGDNEYTDQFSNLKEDTSFICRGEDYYTRRLFIKVVPTPTVAEMYLEEYRPAYLYYRVAGDKPEAIRGQKQYMGQRKVSVLGGDTTRLDGIPAGTDLVLTAATDKALRADVRLVPPPGKVREAVQFLNDPTTKLEKLDEHTFRLTLKNVRATPRLPEYDFYFEFVDTDGVVGRRHVIIKPLDDLPPEVEANPEFVRRTPQGYMVTPQARVPLSVKITDDRGLSGVEFACTVAKVDRGAEQGAQGVLAMGIMQLAPAGPGGELAALSRFATLSKKSPSGKPDAEDVVKRFPSGPFEQELRNQPEFFSPDRILGMLAQPPGRSELYRRFEIKPQEKDPKTEADWFFNVEALGLKVDQTTEVQPRYRMQLWMEAVDNDIETGPHRGVSKDKFTFLVVSENELMAEVGKEEESLYVKVGERVRALQDGEAKLDRVKEDLTAAALKPEQFAGMAARADELSQTLDKAELVVSEVLNDYRRILIELIVNRVEPNAVGRVETLIVTPLESVLKTDFPRTKEGVVELRKVLEGATDDLGVKVRQARSATDEARARLQELIRNLAKVQEQMESGIDLAKLRAMLTQIDQEQERQKRVLKAIEESIKQGALDILTGGGTKP